MTDTTAGIYGIGFDHSVGGFAKLRVDGQEFTADAIRKALAAQPSAGAQDIAWVWTKKGSDTDGDPIILDGTFGDYRSRVVLSRTDRSWSAIVNNGHGKSGLPSEHAAMAYAEETVAKLLKARLEKARECVALYDTPAQPDTSAQGKIVARLEAVANLIERPPLDDVLLDQSTALALAADIRSIIANRPNTGVALSASDRACYEYAGVDQGPLRDAFVAGAEAYAQPDTGDVAALRDFAEYVSGQMHNLPRTATADAVNERALSILAALSKPNAPGAA